jgi:hypothetical protein
VTVRERYRKGASGACEPRARYVRIVLCAADSRQAVLAVRVGYTYLLLLTVREPRRPLGVLPFIACQEVGLGYEWLRLSFVSLESRTPTP